MADASLAPGLTPERFEELMTLLEGADSVELKLTVPDGDQRSAVAALEMDPLEAEIRQVFFLDTDDLLLDRNGVIARARRGVPPRVRSDATTRSRTAAEMRVGLCVQSLATSSDAGSDGTSSDRSMRSKSGPDTRER